MSIKTEMESALEELERDLAVTSDGLPQKFTWEDTEYPCIPRTLESAVIISNEGNPIDISLTLLVRVSHFIDNSNFDEDAVVNPDGIGVGRPVSGDIIEFHNEDYRVIKVGLSPDRSHFTLHCADPSSNQ